MATYGFCENKCKHEIYTKDEVYNKTEVDTAIDNSIASLNLGTISTHNYSRGTAAPTGGKDGDIYDQYF